MPTIPRPEPFPTAVFFGDAVTTGWQAITHPRNRWSSLVSEHLRWREVTLAADGMGFFARRGSTTPDGTRTPSACDTTWLETLLRAEPDIVTVCLGVNDAAFLPSQRELVAQAIDHDLTFLRKRLPEHTACVIAPYFPALGVGPRFSIVRQLIHETATRLGLFSTDAMSAAIEGDEDKLAIDGIHPDDLGHAAIARAMIGVYQQVAPWLTTRPATDESHA